MIKKVLIILGVLLVVGIGVSVLLKKSSQTTSHMLAVRTVDVKDEHEKQMALVEQLYENAVSYQEAGKKTDALKTWKQIITEHGKTKHAPRAYYEVGKFYKMNGKSELSRKYLTVVISSFPKNKWVGHALYYLAQLDEIEGQRVKALEKYNRIKQDYFFIDTIQEVTKKVNKLGVSILLSPEQTTYSTRYTVESGDTLYGISKKFNTSVDFIIKANGLDRSMIRPGDSLNVFLPSTVIDVVVYKGKKQLLLKMNHDIIKKYDIAVGRNNKTPEGVFHIQNKLKDPVWFNRGEAIRPEDPRNILGSRWVGFRDDIGIHGTTDSSTITEQETSGCVRMYNNEIEELYTILRVNDTVTVKP